MGDLAEIRRFWPMAVNVRLFGHKICVQPSKGSKFTLTKPHVWWCIADQRGGLWRYYERSTLAAAMAAAGFGERKRGEFAERRQRWLTTRSGALRLWGFAPTLSGYEPVKLESRQRPRKGVRLGKRGRRLALAASMGEALELVRQKRFDRGEIGG